MKTFFLLLFPLALFSQLHQDQLPLPHFASRPSAVLEDNITGWSYSKDGRWVSAKSKIPVRIISRQEEKYDTDENKLGMDNMHGLYLYPVMYGQDTLMALVKVYTTGDYKLKNLKKGWNTEKLAYYFLFEASELEKLSAIDTSTSLIKIKLLDYGNLKESNARKISRELEKNVLVNPKVERQLLVTARQSASNTVLFQLASVHPVFVDVEAVLHDFTIKGSSLYGTPALLDYLHYEYDTEGFFRFFAVPAPSVFKDLAKA